MEIPPFRHSLSRRKFLRHTGLATTAFSLSGFALTAENTDNILGAEDVKPPSTTRDKNAPYIRVMLHEADGKPLEKDRAGTLHARDLANDPLPQGITSAEGRARITLANEPMQLSCRLKVPGFGEVYCYADNDGKGYTRQDNVEFVVEALKTRLRRVRAVADIARREGMSRDGDLEKLLASAARPIPTAPETAQIAKAYEALANALHAGERITLLLARHRIAKLSQPRKNFLFGCLGSSWQRGGEYERRFVEAFNFATISWYSWKNEEPEGARIDYWRQDQSLQWCLDRKIVPKGFGYVYMTNGATAEWFRKWPYERVLPEYRRIVKQTAQRYHGRMPYMEIINEAHDKANLFRLSHEQILEVTREACRSAREGSSTIKRQINHCCMWAEYAKRPNADGTRRWSPFRYLTDCVKAGVEFDVVGLQLYYPQQDLLEIDRMLSRFAEFRKPIHITEISCNSVDGTDPASMRPTSVVPGWHGPWTESMQADWAEAIYTLCYSKPELEAVGWWDLADYGGHFWPNGGLLRKDFTPKESFLRLRKLQQQWGVGTA